MVTKTEELPKALDFEIRVLERWLKLWKKDAKTTWYRDAKDHIEKLREFFSAFKGEYDRQVHVSRKQLEELIDSIPIEMEKVGRKYEVYGVGTKKRWIEWFIRYNEILLQKGSEASEPHFLTVSEAREKLKEASEETSGVL